MKKGIICLDFDSTVCRFETLDRLLTTAGHSQEKVSKITNRAMNGQMDFFESLKARVSLLHGVKKTAVSAYGENHLQRSDLTEGINVFIEKCYELGYDVCIVSGGLKDIILPYIQRGFLNVDENMVFANGFKYDSDIAICGVLESPLNQTDGKIRVVEGLKRDYEHVIMIGDGTTDLATEPHVDFFIAYTGYVARPNVVSATHIKSNNFTWIGDFIAKISHNI